MANHTTTEVKDKLFKKFKFSKKIDQHFGISVEMEKLGEYIVENVEEALTRRRNLEQKKILISIVISQWKWKSSVNILLKMRKK